MDDAAIRVGERMAEARHALGLTQRELADQLGVQPGMVVRYEAGEGVPGGHLQRLASVTGRPVDWFLGESGGYSLGRDPRASVSREAARQAPARISATQEREAGESAEQREAPTVRLESLQALERGLRDAGSELAGEAAELHRRAVELRQQREGLEDERRRLERRKAAVARREREIASLERAVDAREDGGQPEAGESATDAEGAAVAVGGRVSEARRAVGLTRMQLARELGIGLGLMSRYEEGTADVTRQLERVAEVTGRSVRWFLGKQLDFEAAVEAKGPVQPAELAIPEAGAAAARGELAEPLHGLRRPAAKLADRERTPVDERERLQVSEHRLRQAEANLAHESAGLQRQLAELQQWRHDVEQERGGLREQAKVLGERVRSAAELEAVLEARRLELDARAVDLDAREGRIQAREAEGGEIRRQAAAREVAAAERWEERARDQLDLAHVDVDEARRHAREVGHEAAIAASREERRHRRISRRRRQDGG